MIDIDDRIIGGAPTTIQQHPHQLSLRRYSYHICGAAILSPIRGLSNAYCLESGVIATQYNIMAGSTSILGDSNAQFRTLTRYLHHPQDEIPAFANSIAILFWEEPLTFGSTVRPVQLPQPNASVPYERIATFSGFGEFGGGDQNSDVLKSFQALILSVADCEEKYPANNHDDRFCAAARVPGTGPCAADKGGALMLNKVIIGVLSWGITCDAIHRPPLYTRVSSHVNWLRENMQ